MKNNQYKKYFDQVSPDKNLIEQTRKKMLDELNNASAPSYKSTNISFIRYGIVAACAVIAAVSVALVPKPVDTNIKESDQSNDHQIDASFTDAESTSTKQSDVTTSASITSSSLPAVLNTTQSNKPSVSEMVTSDYVLPSNGQSTYHTQLPNDQAVRTEQSKNSSEVPKHTVNNCHTTVSHSDTVFSSVQTKPCYTTSPCCCTLPDCTTMTHPVTYPNNPIVTVAPTTSKPVTNNSGTSPDYRPGTPPDFDYDYDRPPSGGSSNNGSNSDSVYTITNVSTDNYTGEVNVNLETEYYAPRYMNTINASVDQVEEYFGKDICPQVLKDQYPDYVIKTQTKENHGMDEGIGMIFGDYTGLDDTDSIYIVIGATKSYNTFMGYFISPVRPVVTSINGVNYIFTKIPQYTDTYFCSYTINQISYSVCFKGYDLSEAVNLLLSF